MAREDRGDNSAVANLEDIVSLLEEMKDDKEKDDRSERRKSRGNDRLDREIDKELRHAKTVIKDFTKDIKGDFEKMAKEISKENEKWKDKELTEYGKKKKKELEEYEKLYSQKANIEKMAISDINKNWRKTWANFEFGNEKMKRVMDSSNARIQEFSRGMDVAFGTNFSEAILGIKGLGDVIGSLGKATFNTVRGVSLSIGRMMASATKQKPEKIQLDDIDLANNINKGINADNPQKVFKDIKNILFDIRMLIAENSGWSKADVENNRKNWAVIDKENKNNENRYMREEERFNILSGIYKKEEEHRKYQSSWWKDMKNKFSFLGLISTGVMSLGKIFTSAIKPIALIPQFLKSLIGKGPTLKKEYTKAQKEFIKEIEPKPVGQFFKNIIERFKSLSDKVKNIFEKISNSVEKVFNKIKSTTENIFSKIQKTFDKIKLSKFGKAVENTKNAIGVLSTSVQRGLHNLSEFSKAIRETKGYKAVSAGLKGFGKASLMAGKAMGVLGIAVNVLGRLFGGELKEIMDEFNDMIKDLIKPLIPFVKDILKSFLNGVKGLMPTIIKVSKIIFETLTPILKDLIPVFKDIAEIILSALMPIFSNLSKILSPIGKIIKSVLTPFAGLIKTIGGVLADILVPVLSIVTDVFASLANVLQIVLVPIISAVSPLLEILAVATKILIIPLKLLSPLLFVAGKILEVLLLPLKAVTFLLEGFTNIIKTVVNFLSRVPLIGNIFSSGADAVTISMDRIAERTKELNKLNKETLDQQKFESEVAIKVLDERKKRMESYIKTIEREKQFDPDWREYKFSETFEDLQDAFKKYSRSGDKDRYIADVKDFWEEMRENIGDELGFDKKFKNKFEKIVREGKISNEKLINFISDYTKTAPIEMSKNLKLVNKQLVVMKNEIEGINEVSKDTFEGNIVEMWSKFYKFWYGNEKKIAEVRNKPLIPDMEKYLKDKELRRQEFINNLHKNELEKKKQYSMQEIDLMIDAHKHREKLYFEEFKNREKLKNKKQPIVKPTEIKDKKIEGLSNLFKTNLNLMNKEFEVLTGRTIKINSGFRTFEEQTKLYKKYGEGFAAKPGTSKHEEGLAVDIPSKIVKELKKYGLLDKYGFNTPLSHEPWHVEQKQKFHPIPERRVTIRKEVLPKEKRDFYPTEYDMIMQTQRKELKNSYAFPYMYQPKEENKNKETGNTINNVMQTNAGSEQKTHNGYSSPGAIAYLPIDAAFSNTAALLHNFSGGY